MPSVILQITGVLSDIQAAQTVIVDAITGAGCTIVLPVNVLQRAAVSTLAAISTSPLTLSVVITAPSNADFQTVVLNLTTVKTVYPSLGFSLTYQETASI
jgi:hypothetical protein